MNPPLALENQPSLDDVFQTACDLPPGKRKAYLDEVCAGNEALRRQVESLIKYDTADSSFLAQPAIQEMAHQFVPALTKPTSQQQMIGKQIANYRIQAMIGKGGMGEVYLAHDDDLNVEAAIKFLPEAYAADPEWQARFSREGRLNADLVHKNIAALRHKGEADGRPFLVFEYVPGESLDARVDKGPLPMKEALPIFEQLAAALAHAHSRNIIHRDLKPANIKITPEGQVKVLDFGIAKRLKTDLATVDLKAATPDEQQTLDFGETRLGEVIGTVAYMSPEQTRGEILSTTTDLWSLGCVMYQVLTGRLPFKGVNTYDTLNLIRDRKQAPDWRALPADTPKPLLRVLRQCFVKDRSRAVSAAEVHETIQRLRNPVIKRWKYAALAATTLLTVMVVAWLWVLFTTTPPLASLAVAQFNETGARQAKIGEGVAKSLRDALATVPNLTVLPYSGTGEAKLTQTPDVLVKAMGVNWLLSGNVEYRGEEIEVRFKLHGRDGRQVAEDSLTGPRGNYSEILTRLSQRISRLINATPPNRYTLGVNNEEEYLQAIALLQGELSDNTIDEPIRLLEELAQSEPASARIKAVLARAYLRKSVLTEKDNKLWEQKAHAASQEALQLDPALHEVKVTNGIILAFEKDFGRAIEVLREAWQAQSDDVTAGLTLARVYEENRQLVEAEAVYKEITGKLHGYWMAHNELSHFYYKFGRYEDAANEAAKNLAVNQLSEAGWTVLGNSQFELGQYAQSEQSFRSLLNNLTGLSGGERAKALSGIGLAQYFQERFVDAADTLRQAINLDLQSKDPHLWSLLGDALTEIAGEEREAYNAYSNSIAIRRDNALNTTGKVRLAELYAKRSRSPVATTEQSAGDQRKAVELIELLVAADNQAKLTPNAYFSAIKAYFFLGDLPKAIMLVEKGLDAKMSLTKLEHDPQLKLLRQETAYQGVLARIKQSQGRN